MEEVDLSGSTIGGFLLEECIGIGGFASVYRTPRPILGCDAAIKVMHRRLRGKNEREHVLRFVREAQLAARLDHHYAAHVHDVGIDDGWLWIAMEHVNGITLSRWLRERGPMTLDQIVPFIERLVEVIQDAHELGIIHRDIKPDNIMVIERAGKLIPKLLDFGVARLLDGFPEVDSTPVEIRLAGESSTSSDASKDETTRRRGLGARLTRDGALLGTPAYTSPEQWQDCDVGPEADLYALAVVVYEAITGRLPFQARSFAGYAEMHCFRPVPSVGAEFPPAIDRVFRRALAKLPEQRWSTAIELAQALRGAAGVTTARSRRVGKTAPDALRDQIWTAARAWTERDRPDGLLWRGRDLAIAESTFPAEQRSDIETLFIRACQRAARRGRRVRQLGVLLATAIVVVGVLVGMHVIDHDRVTIGEIEQGRRALIDGDLASAAKLLSDAHERGAQDTGTEFMLSIAREPARAEQMRLTASSGSMRSAGWLSDGRRIVTTDDVSAVIWEDGKIVHVLPHVAKVFDARELPYGRIATICADGSVRIWNADTGLLDRELRVDAARYTVLAVAPDGSSLTAMATTANGQSSIARVWSTHDGSLLKEIAGGRGGKPAVVYSANGLWLAVGGGDEVQVYDVKSWSSQPVKIAAHGVRGMAWDPTGDRIVTGGEFGDVDVWSIPDGSRVRQIASGTVDAVAWSPDGTKIVAARADKISVWGADATPTVVTTGSYAISIAFGSSGRLLEVTEDNGDVAIVDLVSLVVTSKIIGPNSVNTARFSRGDGLVITASPDGTARVWKTDSNHELWRNNEPSPPFGSSVVSGVGGADSVKLADGRTVKVEGEWLRVLDLLGHVAELRLTSPVQALRASGDRVLVIPSFESAANTKAVIIDVTSLRVVTQLDVGRGQVLGARFIDGGSRIATAANDGSVTIWSASTGAKELAITERTKFFDVDVSDKFVVAGASAGAVWIWDRSNGRPLWVLQAHRSAVNGIDLNGDKLVTRSFAGDSAGWSLRAQP